MKPSIVIVCTRLDLQGGVERASVNLANLFVANDHDTTLLILDNTAETFYPVHEAVKIVQAALNFGITTKGNMLTRKAAFLSHIRQLQKLFRQLSPAIIISTEYTLTVSCWLAMRKSDTKLIAWEHHHFYWLEKNAFWNWLFDRIYPKLDKVVCQNNTEKTLFEKIGCKSIVIPYVVPKQNITASLDEKRLLTIGWLIKRKGTDMIPAVAEKVLQKHPDWRWKIIGEGPEYDALMKAIEKENLQNQIIVQKPVSSSLDQEYLQASLLVMLSRFECLPLVMLEATTFGVPCVAFDCPTGPADIISNGINGSLAPLEDAEAIAKAINTLIENASLRKQMGTQAYRSSRRYAPETIYAKWMELFCELSAG